MIESLRLVTSRGGLSWAAGAAARVEHWSIAGEQGAAAGTALAVGRALSVPFESLLRVTSRQHRCLFGDPRSPRGRTSGGHHDQFKAG